MGSSPATSPSPNVGAEMKGMQSVALILDAATQALASVGAASEMGQLLLDFIKKGSKLVQPGAVSPADKKNQLDSMQRQNAENGQNLSMMRQQMSAPPSQPPAQ